MKTTPEITVGTIGEALDASGWPHVWRPARVDGLAPYQDRAGYYIAWLDVDHKDAAISKGGWIPGHMFRPKVVQLGCPLGVVFEYAQG